MEWIILSCKRIAKVHEKLFFPLTRNPKCNMWEYKAIPKMHKFCRPFQMKLQSQYFNSATERSIYVLGFPNEILYSQTNLL